MGISQVNTEYIDFNVHLLVANLNLRFYLVVQNQGKLAALWWQMRETVRSSLSACPLPSLPQGKGRSVPFQ